MSRVIHERTVCGLTTARPRDIAGQLTGLAPPCTLYEPDVTCTHCLTGSQFTWYRAFDLDLGGPIRRDPDQAWEALERLARRRRVRLTPHRIRVIEATTLTAARLANYAEPEGRGGRGRWRTARGYGS